MINQKCKWISIIHPVQHLMDTTQKVAVRWKFLELRLVIKKHSIKCFGTASNLQIFSPFPAPRKTVGHQKSWPVATGEQLSREDIPDVQAPTWSPGNSTWGTGSAFVFSAGDEGDPAFFSSYPSFGVHISHIRPPRARWCKLRAALKMGSFMRDLAARRMSQGLCM
ncbi:hypothetical protein OIU78_027839 [Salix suchowensis]|nr:hypothetical protein OIU78_027839 [Salix suchowensis]